MGLELVRVVEAVCNSKRTEDGLTEHTVLILARLAKVAILTKIVMLKELAMLASVAKLAKIAERSIDSRAYQSVPERTRAYQSVPEHSRAYQSIAER